MSRRARPRSSGPFIAFLIIIALIVVVGGGAGAYMVYTSLDDPPTIVPERYRALIIDSAALCPQVSAEVLASQIAVESAWNPTAVSAVGAQGIAQFMPEVWAQYGIDADGDGVADVWNPADAIPSAALLNCINWDLVDGVPGDQLANTLAAYNAGFNQVRRYDGIPPFPETQSYVRKVLELSPVIEL